MRGEHPRLRWRRRLEAPRTRVSPALPTHVDTPRTRQAEQYPGCHRSRIRTRIEDRSRRTDAQGPLHTAVPTRCLGTAAIARRLRRQADVSAHGAFDHVCIRLRRQQAVSQDPMPAAVTPLVRTTGTQPRSTVRDAGDRRLPGVPRRRRLHRRIRSVCHTTGRSHPTQHHRSTVALLNRDSRTQGTCIGSPWVSLRRRRKHQLPPKPLTIPARIIDRSRASSN